MSIEEKTLLRRNFFAALWHGAFLALGMALTQPTTVVAAFVADLTGSTIWVGGLSTVLTVAGALLQCWSYQTLFLIAAVFIAMGALLTRCLPDSNGLGKSEVFA